MTETVEGSEWEKAQRARYRCLCCDTPVGPKTGYHCESKEDGAQRFHCGTCGAELVRDAEGEPWRLDETLPQPENCPPAS